MARLTPVQERVMVCLNGDWQTEPGSGMSITINGRRMCNVDTMLALERVGLVEQVKLNGVPLVGQWKAK